MTKAIIEDYNGNTISEIPINLSYLEMGMYSFKSIELGEFSIADIDEDEEGNECVRFQYTSEGEVPQQEINSLITNLNH
jgi:hypothetical protein